MDHVFQAIFDVLVGGLKAMWRSLRLRLHRAMTVENRRAFRQAFRRGTTVEKLPSRDR